MQEARAKIPELPSRLRWHFVGHLQKNKIRHALPLFELFHGIDDVDLARDMNRIAEEDGMHPRILLEVNVAGEGSKFGFKPDKLREQMETLLVNSRIDRRLDDNSAAGAGGGSIAKILCRSSRIARPRWRKSSKVRTSAAFHGHDERFRRRG